jgi:DNA phosphorothioation-dependent restriction protein DptG
VLRYISAARDKAYSWGDAGQIVWENNFIENCRVIGQEFVWARDMIELLTNCELDKKKYLREMIALAKDQRVEASSQT